MALESSAVVGRHMPSVASPDDLTAMIAADKHGHRYELTPRLCCRLDRRTGTPTQPSPRGS